MSTLIVTPSFTLIVVPMLVCPTLYSAILYPCYVCRRLRFKKRITFTAIFQTNLISCLDHLAHNVY